MWDQHWSRSRRRSNLNLQTRFISLLEMEPTTSSTVNPAQTKKGWRAARRQDGGSHCGFVQGLTDATCFKIILFYSHKWKETVSGSINVSSVLILSAFTSYFTLIYMSWRGKVYRAVRFSELSFFKNTIRKVILVLCVFAKVEDKINECRTPDAS